VSGARRFLPISSALPSQLPRRLEGIEHYVSETALKAFAEFLRGGIREFERPQIQCRAFHPALILNQL
jgi:hypothetical protein